MSFATSTPLAFTVSETEHGTRIVALYTYREDWFGFRVGSDAIYHVAIFEPERGASEANRYVDMPEMVHCLEGRKTIEGFWSEYAGEEIPDAAFEGRVR